MRRTSGGHEFEVRVWATAERLVGLRKALARWAAGTSLADERQEDLLLAAYEAMANSAEHAYPDGEGGPLEVTARCEADELTVVVADEGSWKTPESGGDPARARPAPDRSPGRRQRHRGADGRHDRHDALPAHTGLTDRAPRESRGGIRAIGRR